MAMEKTPLNLQTIALEEAETKIRIKVKDEFLKRTPKREIDKMISAIIRDAERKIKISALAEAARKSLLDFYNRQYKEIKRSLSAQISVIAAFALLNGENTEGIQVKPTKAERAAAWRTVEETGYTGARVMGSAMQKYSEDYIRQNVQPALDRLAKQFPYDPDSGNGKTPGQHRASLRNRAEYEVRYLNAENNIESLRSQEVRLVVISAHADCSERCRKAQGGVYSLDGTSGRTDDGRKYEPLENVTDIPLITKSGKVYPRGNGILYGFNCRHYAVPYKTGYRFPKPNAEEERKEYEISKMQRRLERSVREWRTRAVEAKGVNPKEYIYARKKAMEWNERYIRYSMKNNRAFYPSRTKLI
ncbi:MAG: phage minor capsid protein [Candidatus Gallimonas sp.]